MPQSLDGNQYLQYILRRWKFIALVCVGALILAFAITLLLPKRYTATASLLIDPPAGSDPRAAVAVSTVYLESLRSYEVLASGDSLFTRVLEKFHLRDSQSSEPLETMKRRILKVTKPRDTRVLQVSVTLPDPGKAQSVAQFIAEETVNMSQGANRDSDKDLVAEAQALVDESRAKLDRAESDYNDLNIREPIEPLRAALQSMTDLQGRVRQDLQETRAQAAELSASSSDPRAAGARARAAALEQQDADLTKQIAAKAAQLSKRSAHDDALRSRAKIAQTNLEGANIRLREVRSNVGLRGERLRMIDAGAIPEKPSSPILILNLAVALGVALLASIAYLTLTIRPDES